MPDQKISELTEVTAPVGTEMLPIVSGGITEKIKAQTIADLALNTLPLLSSGTYAPTVLSQTNCIVAGPVLARYSRVGNIVTVSGTMGMIIPSTGFGSFTITLPIASTFSDQYKAQGTAVMNYTSAIPNLSMKIISDFTANSLGFTFAATTTTAGSVISFICQYEII